LFAGAKKGRQPAATMQLAAIQRQMFANRAKKEPADLGRLWKF